MTLATLIERLEKTQGPMRDLDALIAIEMGVNPGYQGDGVWDCPRYTSSVDAALTLMQADLDFGFNMDCESVHGGWCGYVWLDHPTNRSSFVRTRRHETRAGMMADLPRVICIAALKGLRAIKVRQVAEARSA